jgi:hyaluronoglucosaminidase
MHPTLLRHLRALASSAVILLAAGLLPPAAQQQSPATAQQSAIAPDPVDAAGAVTPEPQQLTPRGDGFPISSTVGLVRGAEADPDAERVVRETLTQAGVRTIRATDGTDPGTDLTVWLGHGTAALAELKVAPATGLAAEGYALAAGVGRQHRKHIVLDGVDADGTFYAAQTLRQLVQARNGADWMPGIAVRDWPTLRYRGSIEGFYGTPWSHADRLDHIDYLGSHKLNTYEYAPKDDPYHREKWREPYPADKLAQLGELVGRARANKVDFTFALSPGVDICYTSDADFHALIAKFEAVFALGGRSFNVPLDDINYSTWHCDADRLKYGTGGGAAGRAQSDLLNRVQREWVETKPGVAPLQMVPTEYHDTADSPYKTVLREQLDSDVVVHWTGVTVIPHDITAAQAAQARQVFGHEILIWDNYPVNDYLAGKLPLGDYRGRSPGIASSIAGIISNPMNQAAVSKVALYSFAEFGWHTSSYDGVQSWLRALAERAGGDPATTKALHVFADLNTSDTRVHSDSAPELAAKITAFWQTWKAGDHAAAAAHLRPAIAAIEAAPATVRSGVIDAAFADQAKVWLDATVLWGAAMRQSLAVLTAVADGNDAAAWSARQQADSSIAQAKAIRDVRSPHNSTYPRIGERVIDAFVAEINRIHDQSLGIQPRHRTATSTLTAYGDQLPARMIDGDLDTWYWSDSAPKAGDEIAVDLGDLRAIGDIAVLMGKAGSPNDFIHSGALEWSADGTTWTELTQSTTAEIRTTAPAGTKARYVRYRALAPNPGFWLVVREFSVQVTDGSERTLTATGTPPPAPGSSFPKAADGDVATSYDAATAPAAGDTLSITLSRPRQLTGVTVLQRSGATGTGRIQLRADGSWRDIGAVSAAYSAVQLPTTTTDAIRIVWTADGTAPRVAEVVPHLAPSA